MQSEPNTVQTPFQINVAERVKRLPPYLFGKINALKSAKRRAGIDVIDLGMGNPSDVPDPQVIDKLCEAARDERNHRYSVSNGLHNLRREVALRYARRHGAQLDPDTEIIAGLGSKEVFSHMCLALLGPGDTAIVPAPSFPIHVYAVALASGNVISLDCTKPDRFLSDVANVCEHLYPKPKVLILNYPHNPSTTVVERDFLHGRGQAGPAFRIHGDPRFRLWRRVLRRLPGAELSECAGGEGSRRRDDDDEQGLQHGRLAARLLRGQRRDGPRPGHHQGLLRLRHLPADSDRRHHRAAAWRGTGRAQALEYQRRRDVLVDALQRIGWDVVPPKASMFVWARYPQEWRERLGSIDFAMKLLDEAEVAVSPGRGFGEAGEGYLRLALVENEQRLRQAVRQIARCLRVEGG